MLMRLELQARVTGCKKRKKAPGKSGGL